MSKGIIFRNHNNEKIYPCPFMPVGSIYLSINSTNPSTYFDGNWTLLKKEVVDTGWVNFSWTNSSYIGTSQSSFTQNKWRVKDNVLYIDIGVGATANIDTGTEYEIARIPIKGNTSYNSTAKRVWIGAIGGSGAQAGFMLLQNSDYISIYLKPHTKANDFVAPWYSTHFAVPLDSEFTFASGNYTTQYTWRRTA